jgi:hypothetical protein
MGNNTELSFRTVPRLFGVKDENETRGAVEDALLDICQVVIDIRGKLCIQ